MQVGQRSCILEPRWPSKDIATTDEDAKENRAINEALSYAHLVHSFWSRLSKMDEDLLVGSEGGGSKVKFRQTVGYN